MSPTKNYNKRRNEIKDQALESAVIDHESSVRSINCTLGRCSDTCRYTTLFIAIVSKLLKTIFKNYFYSKRAHKTGMFFV